MFRYEYEQVNGNTTTSELEFLSPNMSRCVKFLKFVGDNRKTFIIGGFALLMLIGGTIVGLLLSAGQGKLNSDSFNQNVVGKTLFFEQFSLFSENFLKQ